MELSYALRRPIRPSRLRPPLLVLLHGIGGNAQELLAYAQALDPRFLILSPCAPFEYAPGRHRWFDVDFTPQGPIIDAAEAEQSRRRLVQFINDAVMAFGADPRLVFLLGFSQGATLAYSLALTAPCKLRALVAIAGRVLPEVAPLAAAAAEMRHLTLLIQHGREDPVVPIARGYAARELFVSLRVMLGFREYAAGHALSPEMLRDAAEFLSVQFDRATRVRGE